MHFLTPAFKLPSVFVVYFVIERKEHSIYLHIHPNTVQQIQVRSVGFEALSSLKLHPGGLNYSLVLQHHAGQTAVLQALTLGHMRSNEYSTTKIFVDNFLLSTLSIMTTNRCSPTPLIHAQWKCRRFLSLFQYDHKTCTHHKNCLKLQLLLGMHRLTSQRSEPAGFCL